MDGWWKDVRFGLRQLVRNPGFAAVAIVTIALGIGANTAIFSVVQAVLLRPLPYAEPDRLVMIWGELTSRDILHFPSSPPDLRDIREQSTLLEGVEGAFTFRAPVNDDADEPEQIEFAGVTPGFLAMLGVRPLHGRLFEPADATPPAPPPTDAAQAPPAPPDMVLLSHGLWQRRYGGDPGVVGRSVETGLPSGRAMIIGVLPPGLRLHLPATAAVATEIDAWFTPRIDYATAPRNNVFLRPVGRLRPGARLAQAQAELSGIAARLAATDERKMTAGYRLRVAPLQADLTAGVRPIVIALLGAVGFVLLIACANVSNLLLVRAAAREREIAVRAALGGSRFRIVRQVLTESLTLALLGALLGTGLAAVGIRVLLALQPGDIPRLDSVSIDGTVLAFAAAAALISALVFGALPALQASRPDLGRSLKDRGHAAGARAHGLVRAGVVITEVALSLVLLIGAGLMLRSFAALREIDPGFEPANALTFAVPLPQARYPTAEARATFDRQLHDRLAALPEVESVTATQALPLSQQMPLGPYGAEAASIDLQHLRQAYVQTVLPGYFETMRTRIVEGRAFTPADNADSAAVVVVDRVLAEKTWPGESAIGQRLLTRWFTQDYIWVEVVGVAEHQRHTTLAAENREGVYFPDRFVGSAGLKTWVLRTTGDPLRAVPAARAEIAALDALLPMSNVRPLHDYVRDAMGATRFALALIAIFAAAALVLAAVGLYGVIAYMVRQRTAEIGVRMAFGARPRAILEMIVGQGLRLAAAGILIGLVAAFALTRVLASQLVGIGATDPMTFATVALAFVLVTGIACYVPARRATRIDPVVALREE